MDYLERLLDKLRELAQKIIEGLRGPQADPAPELVPIPVQDRRSRPY